MRIVEVEQFWRTMGFAKGWKFSDDPHSLPWAHMKKHQETDYIKVLIALKGFGGATNKWQLVESPKGDMAIHIHDPKLVARIKSVQEICSKLSGVEDRTVSVLAALLQTQNGKPAIPRTR